LSTVRWSQFPEYEEELRAGVAYDLTAVQIAENLVEKFGLVVTRDQVSGRIARLGLRGAHAPVLLSPEERFERRVKTERQKAADRALAREMASAAQGRARWEEFADIVRGELVAAPDFEVPAPIVLPKATGTPEQMVLHISDPHAGKLVDPTVTGLGLAYSSGIFESRLKLLENRVVRLFLLHSQNAPISDLQLYFTGDGVDGVDMRRGHSHRTDIQAAAAQAIFLEQAFSGLTFRLRATLGVPVHWEWRYGNHGRIGEFGVNLPYDNWDYVAGHMLSIRLEADKGSTINLPTTKTALTRLGPLTVLSGHGDGGRKGGGGYFGIPLGSIAANYVADVGLNQQLIDLYILGHWHQTMDSPLPLGGRVLMSSAWDGGDDYSVNNIKAASQPEQWAFGVHPERGITWQYRIQLAPRRLPTEVR